MRLRVAHENHYDTSKVVKLRGQRPILLIIMFATILANGDRVLCGKIKFVVRLGGSIVDIKVIKNVNL